LITYLIFIGLQGDAGMLHRHAEVLRHEDNEEKFRALPHLQEGQQRTLALHSASAVAGDGRLHAKPIRHRPGSRRGRRERLVG